MKRAAERRSRPALLQAGLTCVRIGAAVVLSAAGVGAMAQGAQVLTYSDFGRPDIVVSAASIRQVDGVDIVAYISQELDVSGTDLSQYPTGSCNIADISQTGSGHRAFLTQRGDLNRARIVQTGTDNLVEASQTGVANSLDVTQTGISNSLLASQNGRGNSISLTQAGGNVANLSETGDNNTISVRQVVGGASINLNLVGSGYKVTITQ